MTGFVIAVIALVGALTILAATHSLFWIIFGLVGWIAGVIGAIAFIVQFNVLAAIACGLGSLLCYCLLGVALSAHANHLRSIAEQAEQDRENYRRVHHPSPTA